MKKTFILLVLIMSGLVACTQPGKTGDNMPEKLNTRWVNSWNNKDSAAIVNMFANDVTLNAGRVYTNIDSMRHWVSFYLPRIANLKTKKVKVVEGTDMITYSCTFEHQEIRKDAVAGLSTGLSTFVYVKTGNDWKITYIHMNEFQ